MLLAKLPHTVGDTRRRVVDYRLFLEPGENSISSATVTVDKADVTISGVRVITGEKVEFYAAGGSLNEVFTVTVQCVLRTTETVTDTIQFTGVAP
jgi:hypothetical protein